MHTYMPCTLNWHKFRKLYQINDDYLSEVKLMVIFIHYGGVHVTMEVEFLLISVLLSLIFPCRNYEFGNKISHGHFYDKILMSIVSTWW